MLVYVDDILVVGRDLSRVQEVKQQMKAAFTIADMGEVEWFLGIRIQRDRAKGVIRISQKTMAEDILARFNMNEAKPFPVPIKRGAAPCVGGDVVDVPYGELVGSLMYLMVCTRPDLAYAVGVLARYMQTPTAEHWTLAKGVLRYLKGTTDLGLEYRKGSATVVGFGDADYGGDLDTRRSTTGFVFLMADGAVSWSSRRQRTVAVSTAEAEYQAAAAATKEGLWLKQLMQDLGQPVFTVPIRSDNQAALTLVADPVIGERSKHIDIIHHFVRERVQMGEVSFSYISTTEMVADALTKAVEEHKFVWCRKAMGMR